MTPTIKLHRLTLENFGPFAGDHELDLPSNGLHMVLGENTDTEESSGAGKSSLVESLAYAFDYSDFNATDLQTWEWLAKGKGFGVALSFDIRGTDVGLVRGKKSVLKVTGKDPVTSASAVKEELNRLLGIRPEVLKALTYRPQDEPGLFLAMTDQEKKSFLTELLGLQQYESEVEGVVKVITTLEETEKLKAATAEAMKSQVPAEPTMPAPLNTAELDASAASLSEEVAQAETNLKKLREADTAALAAQQERERAVNAQWGPHLENLEVAVAELEARPLLIPPPVKPEPPANLPDLRKKLELLRGGISKAKLAHQEKLKKLRWDMQSERNDGHRLRLHAQGQTNVAVAERKRLVSEVAVLEQQVCDRCERPWSDEKYSAVLAEKRRAITSCEVVIKMAENELVLADAADHRADELDKTLTFESAADPVPPKLAEGEREFAQKVADAEAAHRAALADVERQHNDRVRILRAEKQAAVAEARERHLKATTEYMAALHRAQEMTPEHVQLREQMTAAKELRDQLASDFRLVQERAAALRREHRERQAVYQRELETWNVAYNRYRNAVTAHEDMLATLDRERDYLGCIRSFLGVIFDETLNRVAYLTNQRLAKVPNVQGLTLRFVSERETKTTKNLRQEIRPIVERDGHEIPLKRTSGGQFTAVELAVDLSLADVIAERTGIMPGWLVLDECFEGLPVKSKTACIELLKEASADRLILVIDHMTEVKEFFDSTIIVRSRNGLSAFA